MQERGSTHKPVSDQEVDLFKAKLTSEEADSYFRQVKETLTSAKENPYQNRWGKLRGHLAESHLKSLIHSYGILLPLTLQECVREGRTVEATRENLQGLLTEVGMFLSGFKNTDVTLISQEQIIPTMTAMLRGEKLPHK